MKKDELYAWARKNPAPNPPLSEALGNEMLETLKELKLARRKNFWDHPEFLGLFPKFEAWEQLRAQYSPEEIALMAANAKAMRVPCGIARRYLEVQRAFKAAWRKVYAITPSAEEEAADAAELPAGDAPVEAPVGASIEVVGVDPSAVELPVEEVIETTASEVAPAAE